jgi:Mg-chelatase subunit ChlD
MAAALGAPETRAVGRWRLVLGKDAEAEGLTLGLDPQMQRIEALVGFLFEGEAGGGTGSGAGGAGGRGGGAGGGSGGRQGGSGGSALTVPTWIDEVSELFPRSAQEVLHRELVRRRGIRELLDQPELLDKVEPNVELVKTLLTHKDLLNENTRGLARRIIEKVVEELKQRMQVAVETAISGALRRDRHSPRKVYRNLDLRTTLRRNLEHYDRESGRLLVDRVYYFAAERRRRPWHVVIAVDQSGSMLDSAVFSAVMASIFYELPAVRTSLFLFDTQVVDLSDQVGQPVDVLMKVQLGGGTNIAQALRYAAQLVRQPARTIVVLITDFFEGGREDDLVRQTEEMAQAGVRMIGLGALGYDARPAYNRTTAKKLRKVGMDILVCTPEKLAECMARIIRG